jgi:hypothetical protein
MNNLYKFENVEFIDVETTTYCNAFCGSCDRNINGGKLKPTLKLAHMSDDVWRSLVTAKNLKNISRITFDGNLGDASMHPKLLDMLEYLLSVKKDILVSISSNGGARSPEWWKELAILLNKFSNHNLRFAIDGLEDTNHIYRRNVDWNKLMLNVKSFNKYSNYSVWRCIVMDHNKHQLTQIKDLAKSLGFYGFTTERNRDSIMQVDRYKQFPEMIITSPSRDEVLKNYNIREVFYKNLKPRKMPIPKQKTTDYDCPFGKEGLVSMDINGNLYPCCHIYSFKINQIDNFPWNKWDGQTNVKTKSLEEIFEFFHTELTSAWKNESYSVCNNCTARKNSAI